jgi:hypothetical protein
MLEQVVEMLGALIPTTGFESIQIPPSNADQQQNVEFHSMTFCYWMKKGVEELGTLVATTGFERPG